MSVANLPTFENLGLSLGNIGAAREFVGDE